MKLGEAGRKSCDKLLSEDCEINGKFQPRLEATESHVCEEEVRAVRGIQKKKGENKEKSAASA